MTEPETPLRIFLVEDNEVIRNSLTEHIEDLLPAKIVAWDHSEQSSIRWLEGNLDNWNVAVLDLFLTQGSGLGIAEKLMERDRFHKIVVLSNYATADIRERCLALGVDAIFDKSTQLDEFIAYMQTAFAGVISLQETRRNRRPHH